MRKQWIVPVAAVVCAVAVLGMLAALLPAPKTQQLPFVPPPFENSAMEGVPVVEESLGYHRVFQQGMPFSAWICGNVTVTADKATVFFTNPVENTVWLKLRVLDEQGSILGETGLLCPGEYVQTVELSGALPEGAKIQLKIMAYAPDTYHSEGAVTLNTTIANR